MDDIGRTHSRILAALWALEGTAWLEVRSEIHEAYKEMPFWILLRADLSPVEAHRHFWHVVEPELIHLGAYRLTVSYKAVADGCVLWHGFFDDLDGMKRALAPDGWGKPIRQDLAAAAIFRSVQTAPHLSGAKSNKANRKKKRRP